MQDNKRSVYAGYRFRPILTVVASLASVLLVGLGIWQVQRYHWKQEKIGAYAAFDQEPPYNIRSQALSVTEYWEKNGKKGQRYIAWANIDPSTFVFVGSDRIEGIPGKYLYALVDFFEVEELYWVRLGFVPVNRIESMLAQDSLEPRTLIFEVREDDEAQKKDLRNDPVRDIWIYANAKELNQAFGQQATEGYVLNAINDNLDGVEPRAFGDGLVNNHWYYALTWFALAVALLVFYVLMSRKTTSRTVEIESL